MNDIKKKNPSSQNEPPKREKTFSLENIKKVRRDIWGHLKDKRKIYVFFFLLIAFFVLVERQLTGTNINSIPQVSFKLIALVMIFFFALIVVLYTIFGTYKLKNYLELSRKFLWQIILTLLFIIFISVIIWLGVDAYKAAKNNKTASEFISQQVQYLKNYNDSEEVGNGTKFCEPAITPEPTKAICLPRDRPTHIQKEVGSAGISELLQNTSNILSDTSNLITYITLFFLIISLVGVYAIIKFIKKLKELDDSALLAKKSILDSALNTVVAVPFIETTQITSLEYHHPIKKIAEVVRKCDESLLNSDPKYAELYMVVALCHWINGDYDGSIKIFKKADRLAFNGGRFDTRRLIAFHLARNYKQKYLISETIEDRKNAIKFSRKTFKPYRMVICLSLFLIDYEIEKDPNKKELIKTELKDYIKKIYNDPEQSIEKIIKKYVRGDLPIRNIAEFSALTIILIKILYNSAIDDEIIKMYKELLLEFYKNEVNNWKGVNVKAAWYRTMYYFYHDHENGDFKNKLRCLYLSYMAQAKTQGVKYLFDCHTLTRRKITTIKKRDEKYKQ